jgi:hypothetical protein
MMTLTNVQMLSIDKTILTCQQFYFILNNEKNGFTLAKYETTHLSQ